MTRARMSAIVLAAIVCGAGAALVALASDRVESHVAWAVAGPLIGWTFVATGLYAWRRRPENRTGALMVLLGFAWFNFTLINANAPIVHNYATVTAGLWGSIFLHLGITFPEGRLQPGLDRALVLSGYVIFPLAFIPGRGFGAVAYGILFVLVMVRSARRWEAADAFERLQLTPVYMFALLTFALVTVAQAADSGAAWWSAFVATGLMPFAFIVGLTRSRISHLDAELQERMEELRASRARLVEAGDAARRKLERDLHDGAQSRLVALALTLRAARKRVTDDEELARLLDQAQEELQTSLAELRELARGIHPAVLTERGLVAAVQGLAARAPLPVTVDANGTGRLSAPVESAAYFVVSEGLANVAKYAHADARVGGGQVRAGPADDRGGRRRRRRSRYGARLRSARAGGPHRPGRHPHAGEPGRARNTAAGRDPSELSGRRLVAAASIPGAVDALHAP
jgi:signal transduction histidine kinase